VCAANISNAQGDVNFFFTFFERFFWLAKSLLSGLISKSCSIDNGGHRAILPKKSAKATAGLDKSNGKERRVHAAA
jgi:hypothetical protein